MRLVNITNPTLPGYSSSRARYINPDKVIMISAGERAMGSSCFSTYIYLQDLENGPMKDPISVDIDVTEVKELLEGRRQDGPRRCKYKRK
jgi:hypothetical protein